MYLIEYDFDRVFDSENEWEMIVTTFDNHNDEQNLVSKHPDPTIGESELSLADIQKQSSHPVRSIMGIIFMFIAIIVPYWYGRMLATHYTNEVIVRWSVIEPRGVVLLSWSVTMLVFMSLALVVVDRHHWRWFAVFIVCLAGEQWIAGLSLLKLNFWNSTYVMYGESANLANAANLGIISAAIGLAVFAVLWVGMLIAIKKTSPLNVFSESWLSFLSFFIVEVIAVLIVMFGGFINAV